MAKPIKRASWSNIDWMGLIRGLGIWDPQYKNLQYIRRPFDSALNIKDKIFRLNDHAPSLTKQGLLNGLCAEFGYDPQNVTKTTTFQLTHYPTSSGNITAQDITVEYRPIGSTGTWSSVTPQVWGSGYLNASEIQSGFIVWPQEHYNASMTSKNFNYSNILDIFSILPDNQDIKVTYWVTFIDTDNIAQTIQFTDMNNLADPTDTRFTYRYPINISPISGIIVYNLNDIPPNLSSQYHTSDGHATEKLYILKAWFDKHYQHTWDTMTDNSVIWDIMNVYSSGEISNFLDSYVPRNDLATGYYSLYNYLAYSGFSGYIGGVDYLSNSLYLSDIVEIDSANQQWYMKVYPGQFYVSGIFYRMFEDPRSTGLIFTGGVTTIPSGLTRGMNTILASRGYFEAGLTTPDSYLNGFVFETYSPPTGSGGDNSYSNVYRRRPYLTGSGQGYSVVLNSGEYNIDFASGLIYLNAPDTTGTLIWDNALIPSGRIIQFDLNPLNQNLISQQSFFLYLTNKDS